MKPSLRNISTIVAATAAFAAFGNALADSPDAHSRAAALPSGGHQETSARTASSDTPRAPQDAHAHAAALLSGSRNIAAETSSITVTDVSMGEHPAVIVARTYGTRGIDPNYFIVLHPAL